MPTSILRDLGHFRILDIRRAPLKKTFLNMQCFSNMLFLYIKEYILGASRHWPGLSDILEGQTVKAPFLSLVLVPTLVCSTPMFDDLSIIFAAKHLAFMV